MAGIFGIWNFDGRPVERSLLARMGAALAHRGPDEAGLLLDEGVGLGCRFSRQAPQSASERQPLVRRPGVALVFDGRLDNREELIAALRDGHDVSTHTSDPALAAAAYEAFGVEVAARLNGDFALVVFDPREHRLVLARDAIGVRPMYYRHTRESLIFASEIKALLMHPQVTVRPNDRVLAGLLLSQLHLQDDDGTTFFDGIRSVPPSHVAIVSAADGTVRRYWDFDPDEPSRRTSFEECAETFRVHFQRSVQRRLRTVHSVAVSVSGGLDSSSIYCVAQELCRHDGTDGSHVMGLTYTSHDGSWADESRFVDAIERHCGHPIQYVDAGPPGLLNRSRELIRHVESPMLDAQWNRSDQFLTAVRDSGARVLLTGHWGDQVLFDQAYLIDLLRSFSWRTIRAHLSEYRHWFPDAEGGEFERRLLADVVQYALPHWVRRGIRAVRAARRRSASPDDWYTKHFRDRAPSDMFRHDLSPSRTSSATVLARSLYREVRSRYHVLCLQWDNKMASMYGLDMAFPFLDRDLIEFVMSVPGELLSRNGVPKALLREALRGIVPDQVLRRTWKADFTHIVNDGIGREYPQLVGILRPDALVVQLGYVDADKLERGLLTMRAEVGAATSCVASWHLSKLLALELWLQEFVGGGGNQQEGERWAGNDRVTARVTT